MTNNEPKHKHYALITGGSKGIGRAFADVCAAEGRNLLLVSLPGEDLETVAQEIGQQNKVDVRFLEIDLSAAGAPEQVYEFCRTAGIKVNFIVNNAGFGTVGALVEANLPKHLTMLQINMVTPYMLIRLFLPDMLTMPDSGILNVASQAGFLPVPFKGTYSATKAFLYYISMALAYEHQGSNVHVGCLMPSGVPTNAAVKQRIKSAGLVGRLSMVEAHDVARYAMKSMKRRKRIIIPGWINRAAYVISQFTPLSLNMHFAATQVRKDLAQSKG